MTHIHSKVIISQLVDFLVHLLMFMPYDSDSVDITSIYQNFFVSRFSVVVVDARDIRLINIQCKLHSQLLDSIPLITFLLFSPVQLTGDLVLYVDHNVLRQYSTFGLP